MRSVWILAVTAMLSSSTLPADGPEKCKDKINRSPRTYASAEGNIGVKILPTQDDTPYHYETTMLIYEPAVDGSDKVISKTVLNVLPLTTLISKRGDVVTIGYHGPSGDAGVWVTVYGKDGAVKGRAEFIAILETLSGADRNLAYEAMTQGRGASFQYDWYSRDYVILPVSPKRTVKIALDNAEVVGENHGS